MFKIFNIGTTCEIDSKNLAITADRNIIKYSGNGEYWEFIDKKKLCIISTTSLKEENLEYIIVEPADHDFIEIYQVNDYLIAHDYNSVYDKEGVWYLIKDFYNFKETKKQTYSFIIHNNQMEEL